MTDSLYAQLLATGKQAKAAATALLKTTDHQKSKVLYALANALRANTVPLLAANQHDIIAAEKNHLAAPLLDRLRITEASIEKMAAGVEQIARLPDPVRSQTDTRILPNGIRISQMRMPIGVIGIIYESRPNVTIDAAVLCLKSGNACILRGGSEALHSNQALAAIIRDTLTQHHFPVDAVSVIDTTDRTVVQHMVQLTEYIDVIIPRGGKSLLQRLKEEAKVPMILHLDGNCHVYVDEFANLAQAVSTAVNAKTYRYGICGAMETLLVHESVAALFLPQLAEALTPFAVEIRGCPSTCSILHQATPATEEDWYEEFLAPILAIKVVPSIDAAIFHIERYGSQHTDSILTESITRAQQFQSQVTSSSVLVNLPTCFADGFEYGLGAEIGISTNKLHARGPVGLEGLTTYKWVLVGEGQLRSPHQ